MAVSWRRLAVLTIALLMLSAAWVAWRNLAGEEPVQPRPAAPAPPATAEVLARGAYLAQIGNCIGCHTARGGALLAGGRPIATPFGTAYSSNLTPDAGTGLGAWSASEFRRALRHGRSRDGRLLLPAFPYPNFSRITPADADALFAWLQSQPPVQRPAREHALRAPFQWQLSIALWRALYFRPEAAEPKEPSDGARSAQWQRGRYLAEGVAHCSACHASRNLLGASSGRGGGVVSAQQWYAPSLHSAAEAGVAAWPEADVVALLKTGVSPQASALGPMAEVVFRGTQHLSDDDARAIASYLRTLPQQPDPVPPFEPSPAETMALGRRVYEQHCSDCHGAQGQGQAGAIRPLAGNRAVLLHESRNLINTLRQGGFQPVTEGNPRPWGMPPFAGVLDDAELAAVASFVRQSWGNRASTVQPLEVLQAR